MDRRTGLQLPHMSKGSGNLGASLQLNEMSGNSS
eukprot:SAG31_NODE_23407_length_505_cov_0.761084_1_plen_33_part_01